MPSIEDRIPGIILLRSIANDAALAKNPEEKKEFMKVAEKLVRCMNNSSVRLSETEMNFYRRNEVRFKSIRMNYVETVAGNDSILDIVELLSELRDPSKEGKVDESFIRDLELLQAAAPDFCPPPQPSLCPPKSPETDPFPDDFKMSRSLPVIKINKDGMFGDEVIFMQNLSQHLQQKK